MTKTPPPSGPSRTEAAAAPALAVPGLRLHALALVALLPALAFLLMVMAPPLNHDVAAILNFSERWVGGERLYVELIDVNPPLIFVLTAIPAAIARWTPFDGPEALVFCVLALCLLSWRMTARLRQGLAEGPVEHAVLNALVPLAILLPAYDVGQREHLMALFALPYAFLAARRIAGLPTRRWLAWGVTLCAALAFGLKPHFLAVPLLVEALVLGRRGWAGLRDPLPWGMAALWLVYLASLPLLFPAYLNFVLPLVMGYYLDNGGIGLFDVLLTDQFAPAALVLLLLTPFALRQGAAAAAGPLLAVGLGGMLSAWVQHKGWSYHVVPMAMAGTLLAGMLPARWLDEALPPARARLGAPAIAATFALVVFLVQIGRGESPWRQIWYDQLRDGQLTAVLRREVSGERLLVLSPDIYPVYPALNYARARSTLRTMNLWMLVGAYGSCVEGAPRYRPTWEMSRPEFLMYRTVAEDFARAPPAGVLVARNQGIPRCDGEAFDPIAYFSRHPAFAETWQRYTRSIQMDTYVLYLRED